ncbi:MAG: acetate--CoA ligase family protein [archaeon]|nr:acetate--CoA ligase family protein [archaeon]
MKTLSLTESIKLVKKHGINFAPYKIVTKSEELKNACEEIGYPLAMKVVSAKISHKTEAGGVTINIDSFSAALKFFFEMKKLKGFEAVIVQKMLHGKEIIIGGKKDIQFGPTVLVGLGGIYVEVFKDFNIGICPVNKSTAKEMVENLKAYPILKGIRGKKGINLPELYETITKVSKLMIKEKEILELDLNPLIATSKGIFAIDARVIVD